MSFKRFDHNHDEISIRVPSHWLRGYHQKQGGRQVSVRMEGNWNPGAPLVETEHGAATVEESGSSQKLDRIMTWSSSSKGLKARTWTNTCIPDAHTRAQSCPTFCNPLDCSPSGFSIHGTLQARILEWVAMSFFRGIFPIQGSNLHLLPWLVDSLPLSHLGSPYEVPRIGHFIETESRIREVASGWGQGGMESQCLMD